MSPYGLNDPSSYSKRIKRRKRHIITDTCGNLLACTVRKQQAWAASCKARAERLIREGRMHPAGLAALEDDKASGLRHASDPIDALEDPEDLVAALEQAGGLAWWQRAAPSYRRNILRFLAAAKRPETRTRRIDLIAAHCARGEKIPQY